jgi:hypothetical protein
MWVLHITVVATNGLHLLSLTAEIIATAPRDGTESRLFYADLVKFLNSPCMRGEENSGGAGEGEIMRHVDYSDQIMLHAK